jgi:pyrrolidone-carboxylate peptidase
MKKLLVTYFGPFKHFTENPAELIANELQLIFENHPLINFKKLEVSYDCIDQFINNSLDEYDTIIELGVATKSDKIRIETNGVNSVLGTDINGFQKNGKILIEEKEAMETSFSKFDLSLWVKKYPDKVLLSENAGIYLCNYLYFKSISQLKDKNVIFIHLANFIDIQDAISLDLQTKIIRSFIDKVIH